MKVYIAGPWAQRDSVKMFAENAEKDFDIEITERWWDHKDTPDDGTPESIAELRQQAKADFDGVWASDLLIVMQLSKSEGKAVETGIALAWGIPVLLYLPSGQRSNLFQVLEEVQTYTTMEALYNALRAYVPNRSSQQ